MAHPAVPDAPATPDEQPERPRVVWTRRAVTDPGEVAALRARIAYGRLPRWRRLFTPTPKGWRT